MATTLEARVAGALTNVRNPRVDNDVISAGMVHDLVVGSDGVVSLTFMLAADDPAGLVRETRAALREVNGVTDVKIEVVEPRTGSASRPHAHEPAATPPTAPAADLASLGRILAISSGK